MGHEFLINSVSLSRDGETFLSNDDFRINLWNINRNKPAYCIMDIKPFNINEVEEAITSSEFCRSSDQLFSYSTSKGSICVADLRIRAQFQDNKNLNGVLKINVGVGKKKTGFSEILNNVSKVKFLDEYSLISRDYLTVKIWDLRFLTTSLESGFN